MLIRKITQYGGDGVMFLPNKIIKNKKLNYRKTNVGLAHGFKTNHVQGLLNNPWFYCTWYRRALQMVLKPHARPHIQPHGFIVHGLGGSCKWF